MPSHPTRSQPKRLETPLQHIARRVFITIQHQPVYGAGMDAFAQRFGDKLAAGRTQLGGVAGVYQNHPSPSFCRFGNGHPDELCPRRIQDAFSHPATLAHLQRSQILTHDDLIGVHQLAAFLVGEVAAPVGDPFVNLRQDTLLLRVLRPVLGVLGRIFPLLDTFEVVLIAPIEAGVVDLLPLVREGGKRRQPHIHAHHVAGWRQRLGLRLAREAGKPLAGVRTGERDRLGRAFHRPVQDDMHRANHFGENQPLTLQPHPVAILRIGDTVVSAEAFEAWEADCFGSRFHPTKAGLKGESHPDADVLAYLTVDEFQGGSHQLPDGQHSLRVVQPQRLAPLLICPLAFSKRLVIRPTTFLKLLLKDTPLAVREVDSVFEALAAHHTLFWSSMYCLTTSKVTAPTVEMNLLRVQSVGRRFLSPGNSLRSSWEV